MRTSRHYRPTAVDRLEDRTVPSTVIDVVINTVPVQDARAVRQEFNRFERTYINDVETILFAQNAASLTAARQAFDAAVLAALQGFSTTVSTSIANLPTASTLTATIQAELLVTPPGTPTGTGQSNLQGHLSEIPTPTTSTYGSQIRFIRTSLGDIEAVAGSVVDSVRNAPAPTGGIDAATVQGDLTAVNTAFQTFRQSYANNVKMLVPPAGTTVPVASRATFDAAVAIDLATLNANVATALSNLPTSVSAALKTTVKNDLLRATTPGSDLQSRLASLRTPSSSPGLSTLFFRLVSSFDIDLAQGRVTSAILSAVRGYNTPTTTPTK